MAQAFILLATSVAVVVGTFVTIIHSSDGLHYAERQDGAHCGDDPHHRPNEPSADCSLCVAIERPASTAATEGPHSLAPPYSYSGVRFSYVIPPLHRLSATAKHPRGPPPLITFSA
ncbi:MAG: hypothetical protein AAF224_10510 [Pseudomonadota bacterium]